MKPDAVGAPARDADDGRAGRRATDLEPLLLVRVNTLPFETLQALRAPTILPPLERWLDVEQRLDAVSEELIEALHRAAGPKDPAADPGRVRVRHALLAFKRDVFNRRPPPAERLALVRRHLPPGLVTVLDDYAALRRRSDELLAAYNESFVADLEAGRAALAQRISEPPYEEGVRLASRSLVPRLRALRREPPSSWGHDERHVAAKALAYLSRFCTKTSPNGLFCAVALGEIAGERIHVEGEPEIDRVDVLLNVAEARKVAACLAADPAARAAVVPRPNPTLRLRDGMWVYWKPASSRNPTDDETLCRARDHPVIRLFLEEAGRGEHAPDALIDAVVRRSEAGRDELAGFYDALVERGILVGEVEIPYNARRPLRALATACRRAGCEAAWLGTLDDIEVGVDRLPGLHGRERADAMEEIAARLESLPHVREIHHDELFRLDAASGLRVRLPGRLVRDLRRSFRAYVRLFSTLYPEAIYVSALASRFLDLHPADTDVEFLDVYHGLFEPGEFHRPASFPEPSSVAQRGEGLEGAAAVMRRVLDFFAGRAGACAPGDEIALTDDDLHAVLGDEPEPRWACAVLFQVAAEDPERARLVLSSIFPGAGLALSRFSHLLGGSAQDDRNPVVRELRRGWSPLAREGAVIAELTYTHNARTANAALRPAIFRHEIELPGERPAPGADVIPLADLVVRFDSARRRFVLRSRSRGLEVLPVITSGVNPVGVISFLVNIGQQGFQPLGYFPGFEAAGVTRWPRVVHDRVVLFRERWVFGPGDAPAPPEPGAASPDADFFLAVARWRGRHRLPRHVFVHTSTDPKPQYVDLESPLFVDLLRRTLVSGSPGAPPGTLHVVEMLPGPEQMLAAGDGVRYATEFLVQLDGPEREGP